MANIYWANTFESDKIEKYIDNSEDMRDTSFGSEQSVTLVDKKRDGKLLLGLIKVWRAIPLPNLASDDPDPNHEIFKLPVYEPNSHDLADVIATVGPMRGEKMALEATKKLFTVTRIADKKIPSRQNLAPERDTSIEAEKSVTSQRFSLKSNNPVKVSVPSHFVKPTAKRKSVMVSSRSRNPDKSKASIRDPSRSKSRVSKGSKAFRITTQNNTSKDFGNKLSNPYRKEAFQVHSQNVLDRKEAITKNLEVPKPEKAPYCKFY